MKKLIGYGLPIFLAMILLTSMSAQQANAVGIQPTGPAGTPELTAGTVIVTTFPNGTTKTITSESTTVIAITGGYLVVDPNVKLGDILPVQVVNKDIVKKFITDVDIKIIEKKVKDKPRCPDGYEWDDGSCVVICKPGYERNRIGDECFQIKCPEGQIRQDGKCVLPPEEECPEGEVLQNHECVPEPPECDEGEMLVDGRCVPDEMPPVIPDDQDEPIEDEEPVEEEPVEEEEEPQDEPEPSNDDSDEGGQSD